MKYTVDLNMEKEVEASDLGNALKGAIETGLASGWKVRNVFINEVSQKATSVPVPVSELDEEDS